MGIFGLWIISKRILPKEALHLFSILALDIALPSLVFVNILQDFRPSEFQKWWLLPLWWAGLTIFFVGMTALFSFVSKREFRREFAVSLFYQNGLFFTLAIITGIFGSGSPYIVDLFLFMLFSPPSSSAQPIFFSVKRKIPSTGLKLSIVYFCQL
jgi:hypothetical protein